MRILIYGLNFAPELVGIGKFTGEMAHHLAQHGHAVRVITAPPYYPEWRVRTGFSAWSYRRQELGGMQVFRCPLWVPAHPTGLSRLVHLLSFAVFSFPVLLAQWRWHPEIVLAVAPAISSAPAAWLAARLFDCPAWLHIQDFELDAALKLKMIPGLHLLGRILQGGETWLFHRFERVSTISARMQERLWHKSLPEHQTCLLPNWVDCQQIYPQPGPNPYRQEWGLSEEQILILYSGSMGEKQGLELVIQAARQLREDHRLRFVLCGDGSSRARLVALAADLENVTFAPLQPAESLNDLLNAADIHLLIQRANAADLVMPSKLNGMLASGKAVIATAEPDTELARVVSQVGLLIPPEDLDALCSAILQLSNQPDLRHTLGRRGREFAQEHYDQEGILTRLADELQRVIERHHSARSKV